MLKLENLGELGNCFYASSDENCPRYSPNSVLVFRVLKSPLEISQEFREQKMEIS